MVGVSALVCTRNRRDSLVRTVHSLLQSAEDDFELLVIDQSDDSASEVALQPFASDRRLRYVRYRGRGKGAALNEGLRLAQGEVVACTDDDCEAPPGWVVQMAQVMAQQPTAAIVFCNVVADPYDPSAGYVPVYERSSDRLLRTLADARQGMGLGAGMALRRDAVLSFGGFDEALGPGSRFGSGDDWDMSIRALLLGWHVYDTAQLAVLHHGFRTLIEGRTHALRDWIAIGALCAKPIRARQFSVVPLALTLFVGKALWPPVCDLARLRRPRGLSRIAGFVKGFALGLRTPVDRKTLMFRVA